jgi:DNA polymerase III delta subunit
MKAAILKEIDKRKADGEDPIDIIQRLQRKWYHFQMIKRAIEERARERDQEGG